MGDAVAPAQAAAVTSPRPHRPLVRGLSNLGNTCFFNSTVQSLTSLVPVIARFGTPGRGPPPPGKLGRAFAATVAALVSPEDSGRVVTPTALHGVVTQVAPRFKGYRQHDAHELLRAVLNELEEEEYAALKRAAVVGSPAAAAVPASRTASVEDAGKSKEEENGGSVEVAPAGGGVEEAAPSAAAAPAEGAVAVVLEAAAAAPAEATQAENGVTPDVTEAAVVLTVTEAAATPPPPPPPAPPALAPAVSVNSAALRAQTWAVRAFGGTLCSTLVCEACGGVSVTEDPLMDVSLAIPRPSAAGGNSGVAYGSSSSSSYGSGGLGTAGRRKPSVFDMKNPLVKTGAAARAAKLAAAAAAVPPPPAPAPKPKLTDKQKLAAEAAALRASLGLPPVAPVTAGSGADAPGSSYPPPPPPLANKATLVTWLQANAPPELLKKHRLVGAKPASITHLQVRQLRELVNGLVGPVVAAAGKARKTEASGSGNAGAEAGADKAEGEANNEVACAPQQQPAGEEPEAPVAAAETVAEAAPCEQQLQQAAGATTSETDKPSSAPVVEGEEEATVQVIAATAEAPVVAEAAAAAAEAPPVEAVPEPAAVEEAPSQADVTPEAHATEQAPVEEAVTAPAPAEEAAPAEGDEASSSSFSSAAASSSRAAPALRALRDGGVLGERVYPHSVTSEAAKGRATLLDCLGAFTSVERLKAADGNGYRCPACAAAARQAAAAPAAEKAEEADSGSSAASSDSEVAVAAGGEAEAAAAEAPAPVAGDAAAPEGGDDAQSAPAEDPSLPPAPAAVPAGGRRRRRGSASAPTPAPPRRAAASPPPAPLLDASQRFLLGTAPRVLTLHLKRFEENARGFFSKIGGHVAFEEWLDASPFLVGKAAGAAGAGEEGAPPPRALYRLHGVVVHSGGLSGGHYIAYVRHGPPQPVDRADLPSDAPDWAREAAASGALPPAGIAWSCVSDSSVSASCLEAALGAEAYLLFYERVWSSAS